MRSRNALVIIVTNCKEKILAHYETKKKIEERESYQANRPMTMK